ncbi:enolase-phosphatase E1-like [Palaemon carinicauda]|uniref:enolase-phosphatase E1-like n=1 Tax=Palaemon carinicauda TaxID=392227 RepID=UPI0035B5CD57
MSVLLEEIFTTLEDRYLFIGLKKNVNEWSEEDILKIFNRLLNVYDSGYNTNDLDYNSKNGRRHMMRYLQRMGLGYLVPKVEDLTNETKTLKVITALDDRVSSKYRELAPKRVRAVVKQEQLLKLKEKKPCKLQENIQPKLQKENYTIHMKMPEEEFLFKSKGHQLQRTPIKPPSSVCSEKKDPLIVLQECNQERKSSSDNHPLDTLAVTAKSNYIPCGRQIPRTPKHIGVDANYENDSVDMLNVKMGKKSCVFENQPSQEKENHVETKENITSTVSPEANSVSCNSDYDTDELEIFPSKVSAFVTVKMENAESCDQTLKNSHLKKETEYCDAVSYPKTEKVTGMEIKSNGDKAVGVSSPLLKEEDVGPSDAPQSDETFTEQNSKGSIKSSVVLDEGTGPSSVLPDFCSSEGKENPPPSGNSPSKVISTRSTRVNSKNHKDEQRMDSSKLPLNSLSRASDEKKCMTQKEFFMIDEKPLAITGTPEGMNKSMTTREYQKNIIPQGKQLKRTPTGPVTSKEFDKDCILVDYSVHETSNSVLEVTKIESKLDYSLQIFAKTKKDKKNKWDPTNNIVNDDASLENEDVKNTIIPKQIFKMEPNTSFVKNVEEIPVRNDSNERENSFGPEIEGTESEVKNCEEKDNMQVESHDPSKEEANSQQVKNCDVVVKSNNSRNEGKSVDEVAEKDIDIEYGSLSKSPGASMELIDKEISVSPISKSGGNIAKHSDKESVFNQLISDQGDLEERAEEIDSLFEDSFDIFPIRKQKKEELKTYSKDGQSYNGDTERVEKRAGKDVKTNVGGNVERTAEDDNDERHGDNANATGVKGLDSVDEKEDNLKIPKRQTRQLRNRSQDTKVSKLNKGQQQNIDKKKVVKNGVTDCKNESKTNNRLLRSTDTSTCQKTEVKRSNYRNKLAIVDGTKTEKEVGSHEQVESKPHSKKSEETINVQVAPVQKGKTKTGKKVTSSPVKNFTEQSSVSKTVKEKKEGIDITNASGQQQKRAIRSRGKVKENLVEAKADVVVPKTRGRAAVTEKVESKMDKHITKKNNDSIPLADISSNITKDKKNIRSKPLRTVRANKGKPYSEEDKENSYSFTEPGINEVTLAPKPNKVSVSKRSTSRNVSVSQANKDKKGKEIKNSDSKEENIVSKKVAETNRKRSYNLKDSEDGVSGAKKKKELKPAVSKRSASSEQSLEKVTQVENEKLSSKDNSTPEEQSRVNCGIGKTRMKKEDDGDEKKASVTCRIPKQKSVSKENEKGYEEDPESLFSCDISEIIVTSRSRKGKRNLEDSNISLSKCGPSDTKKKYISPELLKVEEQENDVKNKRELPTEKKMESKKKAPRISKQSVNKTVVNTSLMEKSVSQKSKSKQTLDKTCDEPAAKNVRASRRCKTLAVAAIKESLNNSDSFERYRKSKY